MKTVIELKNVNLSLKAQNHLLIENINLTVNESDKIILTGINGIGKTTFLKALMGFIATDSEIYAEFQDGDYLFCGEKTLSNLNQKIIYIEQEDFIQRPFAKVERALLDGIQDNIADKKQYLKQWLEKYQPLTNDDIKKKLLKKRIFSLSGGEKKFIAILQGLLRCDLSNIKLVLIDEPVNNLDAKHIVLLSNLINRIQESNPKLAWIIISHCHVFTNVSKAYEIRNKQLQEVEYKSHNCFGACDSGGYY